MAPPLINFIDKQTVVPTAWLNAVDVLTTTVFGQPPDAPTARANLTADAPLEVVNGGTGVRDLPDLFSQLYPPTAAELSSAVLIVNQFIPPYTVDRYGTNTVQGVTDMWPAITAANTAAAADGACVTFLPGELYGVNCTANGGSLIMRASWVCAGPQAIIQRIDFNASVQYFTVRAFQVSNLTLSGLIFDGQVTIANSTTPNLEIGPLGQYHDDFTEQKWSQVYGVLFRQTQFCRVENCTFRNFLRAGLRFDCLASIPQGTLTGPPWPIFPGSSIPASGPTVANMLSLGNHITNCIAWRCRGCFGDAFYQDQSEGNVWANCYAYDYQRVGFVNESTSTPPEYGNNGTMFINCIADFSHDAFIGNPPQGNYGFYTEGGGDDMMWVNCEAKSVSVGWAIGSLPSVAAGVYRPYTANFRLVNCSAVRCASTGYKIAHGTRDVHVSLVNCYAEINPTTVASFAYSTGVGANGFQLVFTPTAGGPNGTTTVSGRYELTNCRVDMVNMSGVGTANCVNVLQGTVTNPQQFRVVITDLSTKWLTTAGANDTTAVLTYELVATAPNNFGYFGDIVFSGPNIGGTRFNGRAEINGCSNETTGYIMLSGEMSGGSLHITRTPLSIRATTSGANAGTLMVQDCPLLDFRNNPGFGLAKINNCIIADADSLHIDRTSWQATELILTNCYVTRMVPVVLAAGGASNRSQSFSAMNCEWFMQFPFSGGGEPGLQFALGGGGFAAIQMNGNIFRNVGGKSSATGAIIVNNSVSTLQINGAGNVYDSSYIATAFAFSAANGGLIKFSSASNTNNDPTTIAAPFNSVNGSLQLWAPA